MMMANVYLLSFLFCFVLEDALGCNKYSYDTQYGTQKLPGRSCQEIFRTRCDPIKDGIYWIKLPGPSEKPFPVFCNMRAGGWTMVYKLIGGIPGRPATIWNMPHSTYEYSHEALTVMNNFRHHYKNRIVQNWSAFKPSEARVVLYKRGKEEIVLRFNAANSNNKNWFTQAKILESSWQDILTQKKNYFTIEGPCWKSGCRDFHINHFYGGCDADVGWLSIGNGAECKWEKRFPAGVKIIYNKVATHANYNVFSKFDAADVFAVFLR